MAPKEIGAQTLHNEFDTWFPSSSGPIILHSRTVKWSEIQAQTVISMPDSPNKYRTRRPMYFHMGYAKCIAYFKRVYDVCPSTVFSIMKKTCVPQNARLSVVGPLLQNLKYLNHPLTNPVTSSWRFWKSKRNSWNFRERHTEDKNSTKRRAWRY
jgi:hypothetical protein